MEKWIEIPNYEGIYEVSSKGQVRTAKGKTTMSILHGERVWKQRILKQKTDKKGYKRVKLYKNKSSKQYLVHRLVALSFISKVDSKDYINHIDGNPSNNYLDNLEWCNHRENLIHAFENRMNKNPDPIILYNTVTKDLEYFRSKAEASRYLNRNKGYISRLINAGINTVDGYEIFTNQL